MIARLRRVLEAAKTLGPSPSTHANSLTIAYRSIGAPTRDPHSVQEPS